MNKLTKQDELWVNDITDELNEAFLEGPPRTIGPVDDDPLAANAVEVGIVILRGCRCVLARSLEEPKKWNGVRIPTAVPLPGESPQETAIRAAGECCDIDGDDDIVPIDTLPLLHIYRGAAHITYVHIFYTTTGPPGSPEDADIEDPEDPEDLYDWYTFARAMDRAEQGTRELLCTLAWTLKSAAAAGHVPDKWGGVFGQEFARNSLIS